MLGTDHDKLTAPPNPAAEPVVVAVKAYGLDVPTSVAVKPVISNGAKKLSWADDLVPFLPLAIFYSPNLLC